MKLYILASLIILCWVVYHATKRNEKLHKQKEDSFWEREYRSNSVRRKPLDNLPYIHIPTETLPTGILADKPEIAECIETLQQLSTQPIVNLTGYSNTDLKLEYGTANITVLTEYDQNYTLLVRTLQKWADELLTEKKYDEAARLMEFAVSTGTDISRTYYALADYYKISGQDGRIAELIESASALRSMNKGIILRTLRELS